MKVTIVTITRDDREGLARTINSVRSQDWQDIEHIVVDGDSSDGTRAYLEQLDDAPNWVSERDGGRYDAMNKGAGLGSGELVWFMHSSDTFHASGSVRFVAEAHERQPFLWGYGLSNIVSDSQVIGVGGRIPFDRARFMLGGRPIPHQASVFSRQFFLEMGGYDTTFGLSADQLFMMNAAMVATPAVWAEFLCDFDASGAGSTRGARAHYADMTRARRYSGIRVTKSSILDAIISQGFSVSTRAERLQRRLLRRLRPSQRSQS